MSNSQISGFALFCEDIREESKGTETLVGILPASLSVSPMPLNFIKLCVYARLKIPKAWDQGPILCFLSFLSGDDETLIGEITEFEIASLVRESDIKSDYVNFTIIHGRPVKVLKPDTLCFNLKIGETYLELANLEVKFHGPAP
jgi:hypothetical protein